MTRNPGPRDGVGAGYLWRALTPSQAAAIAAAHRSGVPARELAEQYGVHVRTIYRAIRVAAQPVVVVRVADWVAEYVVGEEGPVRMTAWHPA